MFDKLDSIYLYEEDGRYPAYVYDAINTDTTRARNQESILDYELNEEVEQNREENNLHSAICTVSSYVETGRPREITYTNADGELERFDGPAHIEYYPNGNKKLEQWWEKGELHRVDAPAHVEYYANGCKKFEKYYAYGDEYDSLVTDDSEPPMEIVYYPNGAVFSRLYLPDEDAVAYEAFDREGNCICRAFYDSNAEFCSSTKGPALVFYDSKGRKEQEFFYEHGEPRTYEAGPSLVRYKDGRVLSEEYVNKFGREFNDRGPYLRVYDEHGQAYIELFNGDKVRPISSVA